MTNCMVNYALRNHTFQTNGLVVFNLTLLISRAKTSFFAGVNALGIDARSLRWTVTVRSATNICKRYKVWAKRNAIRNLLNCIILSQVK